MFEKNILLPEYKEGEEVWLNGLSEFIVEANKNTWANDSGIISYWLVNRSGYKELEYSRGLWKLSDGYTGYYCASGTATVYYKDSPVWVMSYMGKGMGEEFHDKAKETYKFLKSALMRATPDLPFRGPTEYIEGNRVYNFKFLKGDIKYGLWLEEIYENNILTFSQMGLVSIVVPKDKIGKPIYPWNI